MVALRFHISRGAVHLGERKFFTLASNYARRKAVAGGEGITVTDTGWTPETIGGKVVTYFRTGPGKTDFRVEHGAAPSPAPVEAPAMITVTQRTRVEISGIAISDSIDRGPLSDAVARIVWATAKNSADIAAALRAGRRIVSNRSGVGFAVFMQWGVEGVDNGK